MMQTMCVINIQPSVPTAYVINQKVPRSTWKEVKENPHSHISELLEDTDKIAWVSRKKSAHKQTNKKIVYQKQKKGCNL